VIKVLSLPRRKKLAFASLKGWNYEINKDLVAPSVIEFSLSGFAKNLLGDELGDLYKQIDPTTRDYYIYRILKEGRMNGLMITTPQKETLDDIILKSFKDGVKDISAQYGSDTTKMEMGRYS